jgi:hypothetical protein
MSKEIMQQALTVLKAWDALIKYQYGGSSEAMTAMQNVAWRTLDTIEGLEQELAKPEQEPVAWETFALKFANGQVLSYEEPKDLPSYLRYRPLYAAPPRKEWVGLTDDEIDKHERNSLAGADSLFCRRFYKSIEAKLKEKNGAT